MTLRRQLILSVGLQKQRRGLLRYLLHSCYSSTRRPRSGCWTFIAAERAGSCSATRQLEDLGNALRGRGARRPPATRLNSCGNLILRCAEAVEMGVFSYFVTTSQSPYPLPLV
jgi:hypothetical protein